MFGMDFGTRPTFDHFPETWIDGENYRRGPLAQWARHQPLAVCRVVPPDPASRVLILKILTVVRGF